MACAGGAHEGTDSVTSLDCAKARAKWCAKQKRRSAAGQFMVLPFGYAPFFSSEDW
jgi:hypothetical protein